MGVLYVSNRTGATYRLNVDALEQAEAEGACNDVGGHLVSYASLAEQYEVRTWLVRRQRLRSLVAACQSARLWKGRPA
jgi:hypothetical protein